MSELDGHLKRMTPDNLWPAVRSAEDARLSRQGA